MGYNKKQAIRHKCNYCKEVIKEGEGKRIKVFSKTYKYIHRKC
jgi:hypothetical protein